VLQSLILPCPCIRLRGRRISVRKRCIIAMIVLYSTGAFIPQCGQLKRFQIDIPGRDVYGRSSSSDRES